MRRLIPVLAFGIALLGASSPQSTAPQRDISGQWQGTLQAGWGLRIVLKVTKGADGTWNATNYNVDHDSFSSKGIDQTSAPVAVNSITLRGSEFKFSVDAMKASYEGKLSADGRSIVGTWTEGSPFPLDFQRASGKTAWSAASMNAAIAKTAKDPSSAFFNGVGNRAFSYDVMSGVSMAIVRKGQIIYQKGFGTNITTHRTVNADTPFAIGSISKQVTAAVIMLLAHQHKLSLDDTLAKYVPSMPNADRITLRMLLNQTTGLHNYPVPSETHPWPTTQGPITPWQILTVLAADKPDFAPGTKWEYSNTNYTALAAVIEKVTGKPDAEVFHDLIFAPLHMTDSGYGYAAQQNGLNAGGYPKEMIPYPLNNADIYSGAGAVFSSARDMARWDIALMRGTLLSKSEVATVWRAGKLNDGTPVHYAMGWVPDEIAGHRLIWHDGLTAIGGYCFNGIFPDDDIAVIILTNGIGAQAVPERMVREIAAKYGIGIPPAPVTAPKVAAGDNPAVDAVARSFWKDLTVGAADTTDLTPQFAASWTPVLLAETRVNDSVLGAVRFFTFAGTTSDKGVTVYNYTLSYTNGTEHEWSIQVTPDLKIASAVLH